MKAVILAAGIASRLRPLTDDTPKCLLKVGEKSILELTIDNIIANNMNDVIIVTGYLEEKIRDFVSNKYPGLNVTYIFNEVFGSTNNIYSLWLTKGSVSGDGMLLMDSDIIFDKEIITKLLASDHENCLALKRHDVHDEEIKVKVGENGRVLEIGKEVKLQDATGESIGIEKFGEETLQQLFTIIERKIVVEKNVHQFYEAAFQELADGGANIYTVDTTDYICMEIDTADDLESARLMLL
ncbi:MAG: phosphocholine cytidylyltransferase family protein [Ginsengibacter sp.]